MTTGTRKPGEFCWFNILTPDPANARAFFAELLGWSYAGMLVRAGDHAIGALHDLADPRTPAGTRPLIGQMVKVESADAAGERVRSLGGRAKPAFDIGDQGRMAVCHDPCGGEFDVWEPKKLRGTDVDGRSHGAPSWFEARTSDVERAASFYAALFGWTPLTTPMPGGTYTRFELDGVPLAGMMADRTPTGVVTPRWTTYFTVDDAAAAERAAVRLGGTLDMPLRDIPGMGRFCGITSPQGVTFQAVEYAR
jgi:predicted enzyme related to lactoylglutathione lyase